MTEMDEPQEVSRHEIQLRFNDKLNDLHTLNAAQMAEVLEGLVSLTSDLATAGAFGDGPAPEVRVEPPKHGSFTIDAVLQWVQANPQGAYGVGTGVGMSVVNAVRVGTKRMHEQPSSVDPQDDGTAIITWPTQGVDQVPMAVWRELNKQKRKTKNALRKLMAPIGDDASTLQVSSAETQEDAEPEATVTVGKEDYLLAAQISVDPEPIVRTFEAEGELADISFRNGQKWRITIQERSKQAIVEDADFLREVDNGLALHKDDIFEFVIRESLLEREGQRDKIDWFIEKVTWKRRKGGDDDGTQPPTGAKPSASDGPEEDSDAGT